MRAFTPALQIFRLSASTFIPAKITLHAANSSDNYQKGCTASREGISHVLPSMHTEAVFHGNLRLWKQDTMHGQRCYANA